MSGVEGRRGDLKKMGASTLFSFSIFTSIFFSFTSLPCSEGFVVKTSV